MTRFLVYLSLLLTGGLSAYSQNPDALSQDTVFRYGFEMAMQKARLTGVALTRLDNNAISGSIINEFGVSALDFTYDIRRGKVKLNHVVSFLDNGTSVACCAPTCASASTAVRSVGPDAEEARCPAERRHTDRAQPCTRHLLLIHTPCP